MLPRHACCVLSRPCCNGDSLLLNSYLSKIDNSLCIACFYPIQDTSYLIPHYPATDFAPLTPWRRSITLWPLAKRSGLSQLFIFLTNLNLQVTYCSAAASQLMIYDPLVFSKTFYKVDSNKGAKVILSR